MGISRLGPEKETIGILGTFKLASKQIMKQNTGTTCGLMQKNKNITLYLSKTAYSTFFQPSLLSTYYEQSRVKMWHGTVVRTHFEVRKTWVQVLLVTHTSYVPLSVPQKIL